MNFTQSQIILNFTQINDENSDDLIQAAINYGFTSYFVTKPLASRFKTYSSFNIYENFEEGSPKDPNILIYALLRPYNQHFQKLKDQNYFNNQRMGVKIDIESQEDIAFFSEALMEFNPPLVISKPVDWTIIPLENLLAEIQSRNILLFSDIGAEYKQIPSLFSVLERGVDGVLWQPTSVEDLLHVKNMIPTQEKLSFLSGIVTEITDIPHAERVCVDSSSLLKIGEGMLVGNTSQGFGFVHGEVFESEFVASRPFRVNAGDVSEYILVPPDGDQKANPENSDIKKIRTKYLSELHAGDNVYVVNLQGDLRIVSVGRVKIETRPMRMLKLTAQYQKMEVSIILTVQYAETVRLVRDTDEIVSITDINIGDRLKVVLGPGATHFGQPIDEKIVEK